MNFYACDGRPVNSVWFVDRIDLFPSRSLSIHRHMLYSHLRSPLLFCTTDADCRLGFSSSSCSPALFFSFLSLVKKIIMSEIKKYLKNVTVNGSIFVECYARARRSRPFNADR